MGSLKKAVLEFQGWEVAGPPSAEKAKTISRNEFVEPVSDSRRDDAKGCCQSLRESKTLRHPVPPVVKGVAHGSAFGDGHEPKILP